MKKKALFFPSYLGSGFGHIGRCLALADSLKAAGWESHFVLAGKHLEGVRKKGFSASEPRYPFRPVEKESGHNMYTFFTNMDYQLVRDRLDSPRMWRRTMREQLRFIQQVQPQVLIGDAWLPTGMLGKATGIPVVQIVRSILHPRGSGLVWWRDVLDNVVPPDPRRLFGKVLRKYDLAEIERTEEMLFGDLTLIPSIPLLDPLPDDLENTAYVGALTRPVASLEGANWLESLDRTRPLVYVTIGGGAVGNKTFFEKVFQALGGREMTVIVSTSGKIPAEELAPVPENFIVKDWVTGPAVIAQADLVVYHGGYGTTMEVLWFGKPSVVVPFHSEQEANGRRLESLSVAQVLSPMDAGEMRLIQQRWRYGKYSFLATKADHGSLERIREAVENVLGNSQYKTAAQELGVRLREFTEGGKAVSAIESLVG
ncbi:MAG: hypothetical protein JXB38_17260 [Anaerolineales bacterium]|nr:hypothetical protein [Anaerolineales bacterium]